MVAIAGATPALADVDIGIRDIKIEPCADCGRSDNWVIRTSIGAEIVTMAVSVQNTGGNRIFLDENNFRLNYDMYDLECIITQSKKDPEWDGYGEGYYRDWKCSVGPNEYTISTHDSCTWECDGDQYIDAERSERTSGRSDCGFDIAIPSGETTDVTVCFHTTQAAEYTSLGIQITTYEGVHVMLDGTECTSRSCIGNIDLARVGDTTFEYHITDTSIYDTVRPGYSDTISQAIQDGLDRWVDMNPHISFVQVHDQDMADFRISMGGTGESRSFAGNTDTYGRVNDIGCLVEADTDCSMKLYVENNNHDGTVDLMNPAMIEYVTVHEIGHLLGLPHHPSALHAMHNTLDTDVEWYDDEYGFTAPGLKPPIIRTLESEESYKQILDSWEQIHHSIGSTENEVRLGAIITVLLNLLG